MNKKEEEIKQENEISAYIASLSEKLVDAIEDIFGSTNPKPTGNDMIDTFAFASVLFFARQIHLSCKSKATMKSVMKSTVWALMGQINTLADPLIKIEDEWVKLFEREEEEGGENGKEEALVDAKVMISARLVERIINELQEDINYIDMCEIIAIAISATYRSIFANNNTGYEAAMRCTINNMVDLVTSKKNGRTKGEEL